MALAIERLGARQGGGLAASSTFVLGFGALSLLSATGRWDVGRSMWDYRAATWGDGLLVPLIAGIVVAVACDPALPRDASDRRWVCIGGALGTLAAVGVQISWLAASDPVVNWTLPKAHEFSFPGWYNAVFTVATAFVVGAATLLGASRLQRLHRVERVVYVGGWSSTTFCGAIVSFGVLLALDSADSVDTSAGQGSMTAAVCAVALLIAFSVWLFGLAPGVKIVLGGLPFTVLVIAASILTHGWPS
jgi:hypothetical protein